MIESSVTSRGQTTLPKVVRESLGLTAGDKVRYVICDQEVRILPVRPISQIVWHAQVPGTCRHHRRDGAGRCPWSQ